MHLTPVVKHKLHTFLSTFGDAPAWCFLSLQGSSPILSSPSLRSGTVSPSPACSARPWWATCTRTRAAGAACDTHAHRRMRKPTPTRRSLSLKAAVGEEKGKTSLNLPPWGFILREEKRDYPPPCLSSSVFTLAAGGSQPLKRGGTGWEDGSRSGAVAPSAGEEDWGPAGKKKKRLKWLAKWMDGLIDGCFLVTIC